jgi:hypothetical protein
VQFSVLLRERAVALQGPDIGRRMDETLRSIEHSFDLRIWREAVAVFDPLGGIGTELFDIPEPNISSTE